ncbi:MAG: PSD1 and planctomycete cytochrome C domain-containing protein, partial [Pirellulales bacterium]
MERLHLFIYSPFGLLLYLSVLAAADASEPSVDFNRDIRPILSDRCFACHGPDGDKREAGLRLDKRTSATSESDSGTVAIVPGKPSESHLLYRITSADPDIVMPPPHINKTILPDEAEILKRWITQGAVYRNHWAFEPIKRPAVPNTVMREHGAWVKNNIDQFILRRLEAAGMSPNPEASRVTLARRLSLDLTGMPPTPATIDAFLDDTSNDAFDTYVDALLSDPHFGERMAIEWLDAARYADSHGYQTDSSRSNWPWRDWVIHAYNNNLPFDQFTIHQIAGDMLENPTRDQIVATGFNRNHRINGEGGIIAEEWRVETIIDRVETTGQTWLGLSIGCARCHDHKYDPISQKEFYALFSIFNNVPETGTIMGSQNRSGGNSDPLLYLPSPQQEQKLDAFQQAVKDAESSFSTANASLAPRLAVWEDSARDAMKQKDEIWKTIEPLQVISTGGAQFRRHKDATWFVEGANPPHDTYEIQLAVPTQGIGGVRLEVLPHESLTNGGFGRGGNGNIVVSGIELELEVAGKGARTPITLSRAEADYEQAGWPATSVLKKASKKERGWAIEGHLIDKHHPRKLAVFPPETVPVPGNDTRLVIRIRQDAIKGHSFGRFRLALTSHDPTVLGVSGLTLSDTLKKVIHTPRDERSADQQRLLEKHYKTVDGPLLLAQQTLEDSKKRVEAFRNALPSAMVMKEGPTRDAFLLMRGEYDARGEKVEASLPAFLPKAEGRSINRLALAKWIVQRNNPLTARVWVNRMWERFFGTGLCATSENLGSQSEYPSHPELLDWLAMEFIESGWDMKHVIRMLVTSATYRQRADITAQKLDLDPANRLLSRSPRLRLQAESLRDAALVASGLLVPTIGGPSVRPWMPDGVWDET